MSISYRIYSKIPNTELADIFSAFMKENDNKHYFTSISPSPIRPIDKELLEEMGFAENYESYLFVGLSKECVVEATNALKIFRDKYIGWEKSLFLLNGEKELSE